MSSSKIKSITKELEFYNTINKKEDGGLINETISQVTNLKDPDAAWYTIQKYIPGKGIVISNPRSRK